MFPLSSVNQYDPLFWPDFGGFVSAQRPVASLWVHYKPSLLFVGHLWRIHSGNPSQWAQWAIIGGVRILMKNIEHPVLIGGLWLGKSSLSLSISSMDMGDFPASHVWVLEGKDYNVSWENSESFADVGVTQLVSFQNIARNYRNHGCGGGKLETAYGTKTQIYTNGKPQWTLLYTQIHLQNHTIPE